MLLDQVYETMRRVFLAIKCESSGVEALMHHFPSGKIDSDAMFGKVRALGRAVAVGRRGRARSDDSGRFR